MARPSSGSGLTIAQLQQIINRRKKEISALRRDRTRLERELDAVDKQIAKLEGNGSGGRGRGGGGRARNEKSLVETLEEVLGGKGAMSIGDIVAAVERTGYRSNAANFRGLVNQTLIKENKRFGSAGRGMYQLKGGGGGKKKGDAEAA